MKYLGTIFEEDKKYQMKNICYLSISTAFSLFYISLLLLLKYFLKISLCNLSAGQRDFLTLEREFTVSYAIKQRNLQPAYVVCAIRSGLLTLNSPALL